MKEATVILVATDDSLRATVSHAVAAVPHVLFRTFTSFDDVVRANDFSLVVVAVTNSKEADQTGAWLQGIMKTSKPIPTLLICDRQSADLALPLLGLGAVDCLTRPLDLRRLAYLIDMLTVRARLTPSAPSKLKANAVQTLGTDDSFLFLPFTSSGEILEQIRRIAPLDTNILLQGETGTGKTRMARLIHELSPRKNQPFQVVNCGALSGNLIESEMFGHVRGAYTGADRDRVGKFAKAGSGTLLLDDVDALAPELQTKLLRVVEERVFEPVGSNDLQPMQARLVVASNRVLTDDVAAGRFRPDLYFRLCVVAFYLTPLRENVALIAPLAQKFLEEFAARMGRPLQRIAAEALTALQDHAWPGNIRELRNAMERAVALSTGTVCELQDLPVRFSTKAAAAAWEPKVKIAPKPAEEASVLRSSRRVRTLADAKHVAEATRIAEALRRHNNHRLRAAAELGISRMTLYTKMHLYGLMEDEPASLG